MTNEFEMTKLSHGALVRLAAWTNSFAKVRTLAGYATERGYGPEFAEARRLRGEPEAWALFGGTVLSEDKSFYAREAAKYATAVVVFKGQTVEIEGKRFTVRVVKGNEGRFPRNSDPISFAPVA
jgi:NAD(P)H-hydrate repair Nnr-like enzyme with NAD(P)H-hydrate dehydratase domain